MIKDETIGEISKLIMKLINEMAGLLQSKKHEHNGLEYITQFLFAKTVTSLYAAIGLCSDGYGEDAIVLTRTMLENCINLAYINKNPNERVDKYLQYANVRDFKRLQIKKELGANIPIKKEEIINQSYEKTKKKLQGKSWADDKTVEQRAAECNLTEYYEMVYRFASIYTHSELDSVFGYVKRDKQDKSIRKVRLGEPSHEYTDLAFITACALTLIIVQEVCTIFDIDPPQEGNQVVDLILSIPADEISI